MKRIVVILSFFMQIFAAVASSPFGNDVVSIKEVFFVDGIYYKLQTADYPGSNGTVKIPWAHVTRPIENSQVFALEDGEVVKVSDAWGARYKYTGTVDIPASVIVRDTVWTVVGIDANCFYDCNELVEVNLPDGLKYINIGAFSKCTELTQIKLPNSLRYIEIGSFSESGITRLELPDSLLSIARPFYSGDIYECVFSENQVTFADGYAPTFRYGVLPSNSAVERGVFLMPKSKFLVTKAGINMWRENVAIVIPDVERFSCYESSISGYASDRFVCMAPVPPEIDEPSEWYYADPEFSTDEDLRVARALVSELPAKGLLSKYDGVTLIVPEGSEEAYRVAPLWSNFKSIRGVKSFDAILDGTASIELPAVMADGSVTVNASEGITVEVASTTPVEVYTLSGSLVMRLDVTTTATIPLTPGLYIIKLGSNVRKLRI